MALSVQSRQVGDMREVTALDAMNRDPESRIGGGQVHAGNI